MNDRAIKERYDSDLRALLAAAEASGRAFSGYSADATSPELKQLMESGSDEDEKQLDTLRELLSSAGGEPIASTNPVVDALVAGGQARVASSDDPDLKDAAIIDGLRANLHHYIAAYGATAGVARRLGRATDATKIEDMRGHMIDKEGEYGTLADKLIRGSATMRA